MKRLTLYATLLIGILTFTPGGASLRASPCEDDSPVERTSLEYEVAYLDLDTGRTETQDDFHFRPALDGWDVKVAYNSRRDVHSVVFQHQKEGVEIAHLWGRTFEEVTSCELVSAGFTTGLIDEPFDSGRVLLVRTDTGRVFKLGNPVEDDRAVAFDVAQLDADATGGAFDAFVPGGVRVTIEPAEAAEAGVRWQVAEEKDESGEWIVSSTWRDAGSIHDGLRPGRAAVFVESTPEWKASERSVLVAGGSITDVTVHCRRTSRYTLGDIPDQSVRHGEELSFFVDASNLSFTAEPEPRGELALDGGLFTYSPASADRRQFAVTFRGSMGGAQHEATIRVTPLPELIAEQSIIRSVTAVPAPDGKDYVQVTEIESDEEEDFNHTMQKVRAVTISGKTVILEPGHENGLFETFNLAPSDVKPWNIRELFIYAETLVIRAPLHLPQTDLVVHARELRFEGPEAFVSTTPLFDSSVPAPREDGADGLAAGNVELYIERFAHDEADGPRFILAGGEGQRPGPGVDGAAGSSPRTLTHQDYKTAFHPLNVIVPPPDLGKVIYAKEEHWQYALIGGWRLLRVIETRLGPPDTGCPGEACCPGNGANAAPAGKPGRGGPAGSLASTVDLKAVTDVSGGPSAAADDVQYLGGARGTAGGGGRGLKHKREVRNNTLLGTFVTTPWEVYETCPATSPGADIQPWQNPATDEPFGELGRVEPIDAGHSWLHPLLVRSVLGHVRDAYINGNVEYARSVLEEYRLALESYDDPPADIAGELEQVRLEVEALLQRLENNLDYFGNPAGWVPMLSFEANRIAFENEIESAFKVLYLTYWLGHAAADAEKTAGALANARATLLEEIEEFLERFEANRERLRDLEVEARAISARIDELGFELKVREGELLRRAFFITAAKKALRVSAAILKAVPAYQPALGAVGAGIDLATRYNESDSLDKALDEDDAAKIFIKSEMTKKHDKLQESAKNQEKTDEKAGDNAKENESLNAAVKLAAAGVGTTIKETRAFNKDLEAELRRVEATDPIFKDLVKDMRKLNEEKQGFVERLAAALEEEIALANSVQRNYMAVDELNRAAGATFDRIHHGAFLHIQEMDRRARDRLLKYHYFTARAYEYRTLREYRGKLNLDGIFEAFKTLAEDPDNDHLLTREQFDDLKPLYMEQLSDITSEMLDDLNSNPPEQTLPATFALTEEELRELNDTGELRINLVERTGVFSSGQENLRIVSIETDHLKVDRPLDASSPNLSIVFAHSGLSRLRSKGHTYRFTHYRTADVNPITWETLYDGFRGTWSEARRSAASDSLLELLLGDEAGDLLLYSRPAAWADIVITREVLGGLPEDLGIEEFRLRVQYDYFSTGSSQVELRVDVSDGFTPNITVDRSDKADRQDARGAFRRVYSRGERVTLEAQPVYGAYEFDRWTDEAGRDLSPAAVDSVLTVPLDRPTGLRAVYRPMVVASPGPELFQRGDANGDGAVDISDPVRVLNFLFSGATAPPCMKSADTNDDGGVDISDAVALLGFLFQGAAAPPAPFGGCGPDATPDSLTCESYSACP